MSNLTIITILAVVIILMSVITALGKSVGAGANVSDVFAEDTDGKRANEPVLIGQLSKILRTIAGVLFGVLLLSPILYSHRINGEPFININHYVRGCVVGFLFATEVLVFVIIWVVNRKTTHGDEKP